MIFKDRDDAAEKLLARLQHFKGQNPLVMGIPRGAMPMAAHISEGLQGELSTVLIHKIPSPFNEEFAIGSVGVSGVILRLPYIEAYRIPESYVEEEAKRQQQILKERQKKYGLKNPDYKDRVVIIVDDGVATGATALAAIYDVRQHHPKTIVFAAAVASRESAEKIKSIVDELVILSVPENFYAVGQFFMNFSQVSDEEVISLLSQNKSHQRKH